MFRLSHHACVHAVAAYICYGTESNELLHHTPLRTPTHRTCWPRFRENAHRLLHCAHIFRLPMCYRCSSHSSSSSLQSPVQPGAMGQASLAMSRLLQWTRTWLTRWQLCFQSSSPSHPSPQQQPAVQQQQTACHMLPQQVPLLAMHCDL